MPEDEEKYFPSTGHSFKLRRPTGKKNRIRLNLVHEWPAFINVFSPNYSPLFLSLTSICRRLFGPRNSPDLRVRQKKKKARIALWLPWICNERLPTAIFSSFSRGERERKFHRWTITKMLDIDGKLRCFKTDCDAFTIGIFWYRIRKQGWKWICRRKVLFGNASAKKEGTTKSLNVFNPFLL